MRCRGCWPLQGPRGTGTWGHQFDGIFRIEDGGVLEDAPSIIRNAGHAESVAGIRCLRAAVVSANSFLDVAVEVVVGEGKGREYPASQTLDLDGLELRIALTKVS